MNSLFWSILLQTYAFGSYLPDLSQESVANIVSSLPDRDARTFACTSRRNNRFVRDFMLHQTAESYGSLVQRNVISAQDIFNDFADHGDCRPIFIPNTNVVQALSFCFYGHKLRSTFRFTRNIAGQQMSYLVFAVTPRSFDESKNLMFLIFCFKDGVWNHTSQWFEGMLPHPPSIVMRDAFVRGWNRHRRLDVNAHEALQMIENLYQGNRVYVRLTSSNFGGLHWLFVVRFDQSPNKMRLWCEETQEAVARSATGFQVWWRDAQEQADRDAARYRNAFWNAICCTWGTIR